MNGASAATEGNEQLMYLAEEEMVVQ